jgi:hypothetical protein
VNLELGKALISSQTHPEKPHKKNAAFFFYIFATMSSDPLLDRALPVSFWLFHAEERAQKSSVGSSPHIEA